MRLLRRIQRLSSAERRLLVQAAAVVLGVRLWLWLLPSRVILRQVRRLAAQERETDTARVSAARIVWAVDAVAERLPRASCLTRAIAAKLLLRHHGLGSRLCLGVSAGGADDFVAHAWLEQAGRIIIGGDGARTLMRLPDLPRLTAVDRR